MKIPLVRPAPPQLSLAAAELRSLEESGIFSNFGPVNTRFEAEMLEQIADGQKLALHVEQCDVSKPELVKAAVAKTIGQFGGLDFIANSAAIHPFGNSFETEPETWNKVMAVNLGSVFLTAHFGIPEMKKRGGGSIVIVASVQGHACQRGVVAYAASKGGLLSLTRALALDHAADKVRVNSVSPG